MRMTDYKQKSTPKTKKVKKLYGYPHPRCDPTH